MMWKAITVLAAAAVGCVSCASAQMRAQAAPAPLAPVFTNFTYFDHHWIQWLPDHPVYEAIEAQTYSAPDERRFVRVFLTERAPPKRQTYFFSDAETAARWSGGPVFARDIELRHEANAGGAQSLTLRLADAAGAPLEWRMEFDTGDALQSYGAGLRPSQGHAADTAYIFHFYGQSAVARTAELTIGGESFAYRRRDADLAQRGPKTGYTAGSYTPVVRLGDFACARAGESLRCDQGRVFAPAAGTLRTAPFGFANLNTIELELAGENVSAYAHRFGAHVFRFDFTPALPPPASLRGGERFAYAVSLDDNTAVVTGHVEAAREGSALTLTWRAQAPAWMAARPMTTTLTPRDEGGYALSLRAGAAQ